MRLRSEVSTFLESHGSAAAAWIGSSSLIGGGVWKTDSGLQHRPAAPTRGVPSGVLRCELAPECESETTSNHPDDDVHRDQRSVLSSCTSVSATVSFSNEIICYRSCCFSTRESGIEKPGLHRLIPPVFLISFQQVLVCRTNYSSALRLQFKFSSTDIDLQTSRNQLRGGSLTVSDWREDVQTGPTDDLLTLPFSGQHLQTGNYGNTASQLDQRQLQLHPYHSVTLQSAFLFYRVFFQTVCLQSTPGSHSLDKTRREQKEGIKVSV